MNYVVFTLSLILLCAMGWFLFSLMSAVLLFSGKFGRPSRQINAYSAGLQELPGERVSIFGAEKTVLRGRWRHFAMDGRNSPPKGVAVLVHGQGKTGASMDAMADSYGSFGWDSLVLDMRAHGESGGNWRTMGFLESKDLSFWLTWVTDKVPNFPLIVHGEGTGASAILRFAVNAPDSPGKQRVKGMVLDNPALNEGSRFRENIKRIMSWPIFYAGPLLLVEILSLAFCGITLKRMNLVPASRQGSPFSRIRIPLVLFENQDNEEKKEQIANLIRRLS